MPIAFRLREKLFVLVLAPLLVLIVLIGAFAWSLAVIDRADRNTNKSIAALRLTDRMNATLMDAERGMRAYVLTGRSELLAPYLDAKAALALRIGLFRAFTDDGAEARAQSQLVAALALHSVAVDDRFVDLVRHGQRARVLRALTSGAGLRELDGFHVALGAYRALELDRYQADTRHVADVEHGAAVLIVLGSIVAVAMTLILYLTISRRLVQRIRSLERNAAEFAEGKQVTLSTKNDDEISKVEKSLQAMFQQLQVRHEALAKMNVLQRAILGGTNYAIFTTTTDGALTSFNSGAEKLLGYRASEVVGQLNAEQFHLPQQAAAGAAHATIPDPAAEETRFGKLFARSAERVVDLEDTWVRADATQVPVLASISPLRDASGAIYGYLGIAHDMTERIAAAKVAERHVAELAEFTAQLRSLQSIANSVARNDADQIDAALRLVLEQLGQDWAYLVTVDSAKAEVAFLNSVALGHELEAAQMPGARMPLDQTHVPAVLRTKKSIAIADLSLARRFDDLSSPYESSGSYIGAPIMVGGRFYGVAGFVGTQPRLRPFSQVNLDFLQLTSNLIGAAIERGVQRERLDALAYYDELTNLPNRVLLQDRLLQTLLLAERHKDSFAVLYLDIDDFRTINKEHGHAMGDHVLKAVAKRLTGLLRDSDTVARLGADEFVIVASKLVDLANGATLAERILTTLRRPFTIDGVTHELSASIGISLFPPGGQSAELILKRADAALSVAKAQGKNCYAFADSAIVDQPRRQRDGMRYVRMVS